MGWLRRATEEKRDVGPKKLRGTTDIYGLETEDTHLNDLREARQEILPINGRM